MSWDVIVIGGGASGLMAAGRAAESGARVLLLEKMGRVGIKLGLTGKGRCNVTNAGDLRDFIESYRSNGKFLHNAFSRFFNDDLISFLRQRGVPLVEERGRRVFPASNRAQDVVRALRDYSLSSGAEIRVGSPVRGILLDQGRAAGVKTGSGELRAGRIVVATGGVSYPETGSAGDGYTWARELGHTVEPISPALVPLETDGPEARELQGLALKNVRASLVSPSGKVMAEEFGEMLFT
ncbi:MAG TPA: aminoacetone oxidase family FAD-binding enzyme, partial [Thermodesulfobacteriota bacterium]|nr:aminoacetone oxidase family FAD-binding enzyme [Thermodesulfobacteriota bacterium]